MNSKQFAILILVLVVIGGLGYFLMSRDKQSWDSGTAAMGSRVYESFPLNEVTRIAINDGTNTLHLARTNNIWTVVERNHYPANYGTIRDLLQTVWELEVTQPVQVGESQLGRLNLLAPGAGENGGTLVSFASDSDSHELLLGKQHMRETGGNPQFGGGSFPDGRYIMADGNPESVALVQETFSNVESDPSSWLNRDFFKVEKIRSIAVDTTNSWKVFREEEGGTWKLEEPAEGETLDTSKISSFNYAFSSPSFEDVVVGEEPAELGLDDPTRIMLETFTGFTYNLQVAAKEGENTGYYLTLDVEADLPEAREVPEGETEEEKAQRDQEWQDQQNTLKEKLTKEESLENWIYEVSSYTVNSVLKDRSDLLKQPEEEEGETADATTPGELPAPFLDN